MVFMEDIVPIDLKAYKLALEESILVSFLDQNNYEWVRYDGISGF